MDSARDFHGESEAAAALRAGSIFANKYRIGQLVGRGGMGVVYSAHHLLLDQQVALKLLLPRAALRPRAVVRFVNEARLAARIKSEHVCRVMDVAMQSNGMPYIAMEFLEGSDLETLLADRGPLPAQESIHYIMQALDALAQAHAEGITHRDLKPSNLFLARVPDREFIVKILDFGISKFEGGIGDSAPAHVTTTDTILGSPAYMAPEQIVNAKNCDPRTDIWATGVILYELLSGRHPFPGDSAGEVFSRILREKPFPFTPKHPVPPQVEAAIMRCLEKERSRRFDNVFDLASALKPFSPTDPAQLERIREATRKSLSPRKIIENLSGARVIHGTTVSAALAPSTSDLQGRTISSSARRAYAIGAAIIAIGLAAWMTTGSSSAAMEAYAVSAEPSPIFQRAVAPIRPILGASAPATTAPHRAPTRHVNYKEELLGDRK